MADAIVGQGPRLAVCVKWVDLRPEIDQLTGAVTLDERRFGFSPADQAALEVGVRTAEATGGHVTLWCVAHEGAEPALRELAAAGATHVTRIEPAAGEPASESVGAALAAAIGHVDLVICGDHSLDGGSGSVPAFVAHGLGVAQALGLVDVALVPGDGSPGPRRLTAVRRLDGGRRERLEVAWPAVISVEGSIARLRRASLHDVVVARALPVERVSTPRSPVRRVSTGPTAPLRPRPRSLPAPTGARALDRVVALTGALVERTPPRRVEADVVGVAAAAEAIVDQLRTWGYLE